MNEKERRLLLAVANGMRALLDKHSLRETPERTDLVIAIDDVERDVPDEAPESDKV